MSLINRRAKDRAEWIEMARDNGFLTPDYNVRCGDVEDVDLGDRICKAKILGSWMDTASFRSASPDREETGRGLKLMR